MTDEIRKQLKEIEDDIAWQRKTCMQGLAAAYELGEKAGRDAQREEDRR